MAVLSREVYRLGHKRDRGGDGCIPCSESHLIRLIDLDFSLRVLLAHADIPIDPARDHRRSRRVLSPVHTFKGGLFLRCPAIAFLLRRAYWDGSSAARPSKDWSYQGNSLQLPFPTPWTL